MISDVIFSSCKFSEIGRFQKVYIVKTISLIMDHLRIQVDWEREDVDIVFIYGVKVNMSVIEYW